MTELQRLVGGRIVPIAGTWKIDDGHTSAGFGVRHLLTIMRGRFKSFEGDIVIAENPADSTVNVTIDASTIDTANSLADDTLRGEHFLNVEAHPNITFNSTAVTPGENGNWTVTGDLTIAGITKQVDLDTEFVGAATSPIGDLEKMSFVATTTILREDFNMTYTAPSPDSEGVWIVGNKIDITLDIEADLQR